MRGRARLQTGGRARGGAHGEHLEHVRDAGGVEAQRLVECRRGLPRVERRANGAGQGAPGRREAAGDRGARSVQGRGLDCRLGAGHREERTRNMPATVVTLEVPRLSGWLNADARCRVARRACDAEQGEAREAAGR
eukprot:scaffold18453_cov65-Phaeocystis_antarctica.AAC.5